MSLDIANLLYDGVITLDDLEGFSEELCEEGKRLLGCVGNA